MALNVANSDGIKINSELLRYCIARAGKNPTQVSKEMGMTYNAFKRKCNGISDFKSREIREVAKLVGLSDSEIIGIFVKGIAVSQE